MGTPFISGEDLDTYRRETGDPDMNVIAIDAACDIVREHVSQAVDPVADDQVALDSEGTDTILLPELPVVSVASVVGPGGVPLGLGTDYVVDKEMGAIRTKRRGRRFLAGRQAYVVTYTHGWTEVPASVRAVALTLAARIYDQGIVQEEGVGGYTVRYAGEGSIGLTPGEARVLAKHDPGRRR